MVFMGATSSGSWRHTASMSPSFAAVSASACASFLAADATTLLASTFARWSASCSSRTSRVFHSCASQRLVAGSIRRVVVEVSADLMTEAAADFSRVSGALR